MDEPDSLNVNNILTINGGSSSLKCALYRSEIAQESDSTQPSPELLFTLKATDILGDCTLTVRDSQGRIREQRPLVFGESNNAPDQRHLHTLEHIIMWLRQQAPDDPITAISHRVVHGGPQFTSAVKVTPEVQRQLAALTPLAPLHQPYNLKLLAVCAELLPQIPQFACFDTMFHADQSDLATAYAVPQWLAEAGVRRYGFHGLSYQFISQQLTALKLQKSKTIVAHLGSGASLCALADGESVATTMGFSAAEGLPMATRTGSLDPGVILYLMQHEQFNAEQIEQLIYQQSGWYGMSGISHDMATLEQSDDPAAARAINFFCYRVGREIGSLAAALGGVEQIVFTGGVGEHSPRVRQTISKHCHWLGVLLNEAANEQSEALISHNDSRVDVRVIPTNEEFMLAQHSQRLLMA